MGSCTPEDRNTHSKSDHTVDNTACQALCDQDEHCFAIETSLRSHDRCEIHTAPISGGDGREEFRCTLKSSK